MPYNEMINKIQKRYILISLIFFLLISNTLVTTSINIAIVSMVNFQESSEDSSNSSEANIIVCPNTTFFLRDFLEGENRTKIETIPQQTKYNWSKEEQNMALAGYYWLSYISILPAGILAHKYGSKKVVGYSQFASSIMSSLIPIFAHHGALIVAWIRAVQGILSYMAVPAGIYTIIGNWSPAQERGIFGASIVVGSGIGQTLADICFGYIARYLHWEYVFYMTSACGAIWFVLWIIFVYDSPQQHPSIADDEKIYIETNLKQSTMSQESVPWKRIVTSIPFIICLLSYNSLMWVFTVSVTYTPIYLKTMYGLNAHEIGIITSVCLLSSTGLATFSAYLTDDLLKKKICTLATIRKTCTLIGNIFSSIPLIAIACMKCDINVVIVCLLSFAILKSCNMYGSPMGIVDISPKFCGILEGICGTLGSIQIFIFSTIISHYSGTLSSQDLWKYVFIFSASYTSLMNFIYIVWGSVEVQSWNFKNSIRTTS